MTLNVKRTTSLGRPEKNISASIQVDSSVQIEKVEPASLEPSSPFPTTTIEVPTEAAKLEDSSISQIIVNQIKSDNTPKLLNEQSTAATSKKEDTHSFEFTEIEPHNGIPNSGKPEHKAGHLPRYDKTTRPMKIDHSTHDTHSTIYSAGEQTTKTKVRKGSFTQLSILTPEFSAISGEQMKRPLTRRTTKTSSPSDAKMFTRRTTSNCALALSPVIISSLGVAELKMTFQTNNDKQASSSSFHEKIKDESLPPVKNFVRERMKMFQGHVSSER